MWMSWGICTCIILCPSITRAAGLMFHTSSCAVFRRWN